MDEAAGETSATSRGSPGPNAFALRITEGVHKGAVTVLDGADMLVIGASDDCDVIFADAGVARHHCVLKKQDAKLFLRAIEGSVTVNGQQHESGATAHLPPGTSVGIGGATFEVVSTSGAGRPRLETPPADRSNGGDAVLAGPARRSRWSVGVKVAVAVALVIAARAISLTISARPAGGPAEQTAALTAQSPRPGASIAHDVAEVLRLSGIACTAQYNGDGAVTVSGHLGDPQALSAIIKSRAIREIVGLKRVMALNLDHSSGSSLGVSLDGTRIVSVVASADPYVVTADGSRYYVGASLPQGGRLTGVKEGEVLVERDGRTEHWKLADPTHASGEFRPTGSLR